MKARLYRVLYPILQLYWFLIRPKTRGVKALILHEDEVLLIKNTYGSSKWTLPGGGVKRGESPEAAVQREVKEELDINPAFTLLGDFQHSVEYKIDRIYCFVGRVNIATFKIQKDEVLEGRWFPINSLPEHRSVHIDTIINLYTSHHEK